jgi:hypothetical protein
VSRKRETIFKERIRPKLAELPHTWFVKIQQAALRGTPDFLMCVHGVFVGMELKASEKEEPSELQKYTLAQIRKAGGLALVVYPENFEEIYEDLKLLANHGYTRLLREAES